MLIGLLVVIVSVARALVDGHGLDPRLPTVRWAPLAILGLLGQMWLDRSGPVGDALVAAEIVTLAALLAVGIVNPHLPGGIALTAGIVANGAAILANAGMPVSADAVRAIGGSAASLPLAGHHHLLDDSSNLTMLADTLGVPWLGIVVSPGDALLAIGAVILLSASLAGTVD